jgi:ribosomal protein L9
MSFVPELYGSVTTADIADALKAIGDFLADAYPRIVREKIDEITAHAMVQIMNEDALANELINARFL